MAEHKYSVFSEYLALFVASLSGLISIQEFVNPWPVYCVIIGSLFILYAIEVKVYNNIHLYPWKFRASTNPGLWCSFLIPVSLFTIHYSRLCPSNDYLFYSALQGTHLLFSSLLFVIDTNRLAQKTLPGEDTKLTVSQSVVIHDINLLTVLILITSLSNWFFLGQGWFLSITSSATLHLFFSSFLYVLLQYFPFNFSLGEVLIASEAFTLFSVVGINHLTSEILANRNPNESSMCILFATTALFGCFLVWAICATFKSTRNIFGFVSTLLAVGFIFIIPVSWKALRENPILWIFSYLISTKTKFILFTSWFLIFLVAIIVVMLHSKLPVTPTTIKRKYFHFLITTVFVSGILFDLQLLHLFSVLMLGIFILLECSRYFDISPIGPALNQSLRHFLDEKDRGNLILSHIYLLIGCSTPLWLLTACLDNSHSTIVVYAGLLTIGIGDSVASIIGITLGSHCWPGTVKTIEGTLSSIGSQMTVLYLLNITGVLSDSLVIGLPVIIAIVTTSLLETFTCQVDNLVIPLVFFTAVGLR